MEYLLSDDCFDTVVNDSTRCVEESCESSTPISNTKSTNTTTNFNINNKHLQTNINNETNTNNNDTNCRSPIMSSVDRLHRLECEMNSFAMDDSISRMVVNDDDFIDSITNTNNIDSHTNNISNDHYNNDLNDTNCRSPILFTPIKSYNKSKLFTTNSNNNTKDNNHLIKSIKSNINNNVYTRFDEPHVNISDDETKNPILASSIRRNYNNMNDADILRSEKILGNSRCWTDRFDMTNTDIFDESESVTLSPIRSLTSLLSSSQADPELSTKRNIDLSTNTNLSINNNNNYNIDYKSNNDYNTTPIKSYNKFNNSTITNINTNINNDSHNKLSDFENMNIMDICSVDYNPMCRMMLSRDELCRCRLNNDLEMLYKHFKNLCTILKRGSLRNDQPYFRIIQMLVQRMSRRSFSMENLLQMLWLAPNLINVRWILVSDNVRKKYSAEYKDSSDKVYDLSIRLLKSTTNNTNIDYNTTPTKSYNKFTTFNNTNTNLSINNNNNYNINNEYCYTTNDYENVCFRFKNLLCCWSLKCQQDGYDLLEIPCASIPENKLRSNLSTPRRDSTPIRLDTTPVRSIVRTGMYNYLNTTPVKSYNKFTTFNNTNTNLSINNNNNYNTTPVKSYNKLTDSIKSNSNYNDDNDILMSSSKRMKINDSSMSPMCHDLLNTPGMQRIRENARKLSIKSNIDNTNFNDLKYWIDMRWFTKMLLELMTRDCQVMKLDFVVDFITKYGSRKVTQDQVIKWIDTLCDIDPEILERSVSKFEDYSTMITFNKTSSLNQAIDHINHKIKTLQST